MTINAERNTRPATQTDADATATHPADTADATDTPNTTDTGSRAQVRRRWSPGRALIVLVAVAFFFGPLAAGALGERAGQIENRTLSAFPSPHQGWQFFTQLSTWATDHLPLRDRAVQLNTAFSKRVFGEPPAYGPGGGVSPVIEGADGRLFFTQDVQWACVPVHPTAEILAGANRLASIAERAGTRFLMFVPPDKTTIEADLMPDRYPNAGCAPKAKEAFWSALHAAPPHHYFDLHQPLLDARARVGPVYLQKDSHWAPVAAAEYARLMINEIDPELWRTTEVVSLGAAERVGDLTRLTGAPENNVYEDIEMRRAGVTVAPFEGGQVSGLGVAHLRATSSQAPLVEGRVTVFGDSFTGISMPQLTPFFADLVSVNINSAAKNAPAVAELLVTSEVVVVESVERAFATGRTALFTDPVLDALEQAVDERLATGR